MGAAIGCTTASVVYALNPDWPNADKMSAGFSSWAFSSLTLDLLWEFFSRNNIDQAVSNYNYNAVMEHPIPAR